MSRGDGFPRRWKSLLRQEEWQPFQRLTKCHPREPNLPFVQPSAKLHLAPTVVVLAPSSLANLIRSLPQALAAPRIGHDRPRIRSSTKAEMAESATTLAVLGIPASTAISPIGSATHNVNHHA